MRMLAIDHGEKRIGVAISDERGVVARPLEIVQHVARQVDAAAIADLAQRRAVGKIIIGLPSDSQGDVGAQARRVKRFGAALAELADAPVEYWDESYSTTAARQRVRRTRSKKRAAHVDSQAAAIILQDYIDSHG